MSLPSSFIPDSQNNPGLPSSFIPNGDLPADNQAQPQQQAQSQDQGNFLTNFLPSLGKQIQSLGSAAVNVFNPNPQQNTLANLAKLAYGLTPVSQEVGDLTKLGIIDKNSPLNSGNDAVGAILGYYGKRYGGGNPVQIAGNIGNTLQTDPVGAMMDASSLLDAGASLAGEAGTIGKVLNTASDLSNPISVAGKTITGAGKMLSAPFKGSYNPDVANLAQTMGVDLPASAMTNNKIVQIGEALASKGLFGQKIINKIQAAKDQLGDLTQQATNQVNTAPDFLTAGEAAQKGFSATKQAFQDKMNSLYGEIIPQIKDQPADASNTVQMLNDYLANAKKNLGSNPAASYYQGLQARIAPLQEFTQKGMISADQQLTASELRATMQDVGNKLKNPNDPIANADTGSLKQLYGTLSQDLDNAISKYDPAVGQQLKDTNAQYASGKELFNSQIGKYIQNKDPEQIVNQIFKPNAITNINRVKQIVGQDAFSQLQNAFMAKLMKNSLDKNGALDSGKLATNLGKYDDTTLNSMLSPSQLEQLKGTQAQLGKIDTLKGALAKGTAMSNGSQTAFLANMAAQPALMAVNPMLWAKQLGLQYLYTKPFTTKAGINFLTKGGKNMAAPLGNNVDKYSQVMNLIRMASQPSQRNNQ